MSELVHVWDSPCPSAMPRPPPYKSTSRVPPWCDGRRKEEDKKTLRWGDIERAMFVRRVLFFSMRRVKRTTKSCPFRPSSPWYLGSTERDVICITPL